MKKKQPDGTWGRNRVVSKERYMSIITPDTNKNPIGAVWARTSTKGQAETSIPAQITAAKALLESKGYRVAHILSDDWSSLDLYASPEFQKLLDLVRNHSIQAVGVLDRDRLLADPTERMVFLSELTENNVQLLVCQGPEVMSSDEGQIIEHVLALGKKKAVLRARTGSKQGLRHRVIGRRLPISRHPLFGYARTKEDWHKTDKGYRLEPNGDWATLKTIFGLLLKGRGYGYIIKELERRGIKSPAGHDTWTPTTLSGITHNPSYIGRYVTLKREAVEPKTRRKKDSYRNSSVRKVAPEKQEYLPEVEIVDPPITEAERDQIVAQLAVHQKLATRNAKRDYLLRGLIYCHSHTGQNGEPRRYHGRPYRGGRWVYVCPGGTGDTTIDGPALERWIFGMLATTEFLHQDVLDAKGNTRTSIEAELADLQRKGNKRIDKMVSLEDRYLDIQPEVYRKLKAQLEREGKTLKARQDELLGQIAQLTQRELAIERIKDLRQEYAGSFRDMLEQVMDRDPKDWILENAALVRGLFELFSLQIHVYPPKTVVDRPLYVGLGEKPVWAQVSVKIPIQPLKNEASIAFMHPGVSKCNHNTTYYPVRFPMSDTARAEGVPV